MPTPATYFRPPPSDLGTVPPHGPSIEGPRRGWERLSWVGGAPAEQLLATHTPNSYAWRSRRAPNLSSSCRTVVHQMSNSCPGSQSAEIQPTLAGARYISADFGQLGPVFTNASPHWARLWSKWASSDEARPELAERLSESSQRGQLLAQIDQWWPASVAISPACLPACLPDRPTDRVARRIPSLLARASLSWCRRHVVRPASSQRSRCRDEMRKGGHIGGSGGIWPL